MKMRTLSIFLLKENYNSNNSLKANHELVNNYQARNLPPGSSLFISDKIKTKPWWVDYFSIEGEIKQESKGALLFLPIDNRCFALTFGHTSHNLLDESYEYDFGLRVTLNSLDPNELKSADIVEPGAARRKRTQVPITSDLTYLDFDSNSEILKSLTGKVKPEHSELFKNATGSSSLKIGMKLNPQKLSELCKKTLDLYIDNSYLTSFPNIQKIMPEKDPKEIEKLDAALLQALHDKSDDLSLAIPEIIDYSDNIFCIFKGKMQTKTTVYAEISLDKFYEYMGNFDFKTITSNNLKSYTLNLCNEEGLITKAYSIYRSFLYDVKIDVENTVYHLCDGEWYKISEDYLTSLKEYIDGKCNNTILPPYNHDVIDKKSNLYRYSEENYNSEISLSSENYICLDQKDIAPNGYSQIEPCDIISINQDTQECTLHHIKISSRSSQLSHLFNQGVNSIELLLLENESKEKLKKLITDESQVRGINQLTCDAFLLQIEKNNYLVEFGIITKKSPENRSENLPLFSKISLMRALKSLELTRTKSRVSFILDNSPPKEKKDTCTQATVIVSMNGNNKKIITIDQNQPYPQGAVVKGCPKHITDSPVGKRFLMYVKKDNNGNLSTYHAWDVTAI